MPNRELLRLAFTLPVKPLSAPYQAVNRLKTAVSELDLKTPFPFIRSPDKLYLAELLAERYYETEPVGSTEKPYVLFKEDKPFEQSLAVLQGLHNETNNFFFLDIKWKLMDLVREDLLYYWMEAATDLLRLPDHPNHTQILGYLNREEKNKSAVMHKNMKLAQAAVANMAYATQGMPDTKQWILKMAQLVALEKLILPPGTSLEMAYCETQNNTAPPARTDNAAIFAAYEQLKQSLKTA